MRFIDSIANGGKWVWGTLLAFAVATTASGMLVTRTADIRYERDVSRMVFNDNLGVLSEVRGKLGQTADSLAMLVAAEAALPVDQPYIVISIEERELWYKRGNEVLFHTQVATGSGKTLVGRGSSKTYKFETPRGRLTVQAKEVNPSWVPPDWHYQEQAMKRGLGLTRLDRSTSLAADGGSVVKVEGSNVVKAFPDGRTEVLQATDGREIVVNGNIVIPPFGTMQRRYGGVLGTRRLVLGDGYGIHGTNVPSSIGRAVSHGCVRLRNEDIERLYEMVDVGTPVYIY